MTNRFKTSQYEDNRTSFTEGDSFPAVVFYLRYNGFCRASTLREF